MSSSQPSICARLEGLRHELFGPRGKSEMARQLEIRPSTYDRYERDRVPPADLLVRIANVSNVTLEWLITGEGPRRADFVADIETETLVRQFREAVATRASMRPVVGQLLSWLESATLPDSAAAITESASFRLPIIGSIRTGLGSDQSLGDQIEFYRRTSPLVTDVGETLDNGSGSRAEMFDLSKRHMGHAVIHPAGDGNPGSGPSIELATKIGLSKDELAGAFAVELDDDRLEPDHQNGLWLIATTTAPPIERHLCIVRPPQSTELAAGDFYRELGDIVVAPTNPRHPARRWPEAKLEWACPVIATVRKSDQ